MIDMKRYHEITESPGQKATQEQIERLYQRYHFADEYAADRKVLEVACGSGIGLGYLAEHAVAVTGGDIDRKNIENAQKSYAGNKKIETLVLDAHNLAFDDQSFDLVLLFEAIYYLERPEQFISEAHRVLMGNGHLIICTVNRDWKDFHPSKYSTKYHSVPELNNMLAGMFPEVKVYGAFREANQGLKTKSLSVLKRSASKLDLIPGSLKAREFLKRIFIGKLTPIPDEVSEGMAEYVEPVEIKSDEPTEQYKIIYAVATKERNA